MVPVIYVAAIYGGYDIPKPPPPGDAILFTDDRTLEAPGWEIRVADPFPHLHPRLKAKAVKCLPHEFHPEHAKTVWIDGSMHVHGDDGLEVYPLGFFRHPQRDTVSAEAGLSRQMTKYAGLPVVEQANSYLAAGLLPGLWASGFHTRDINHPGVVEFFEAWWHENILWTYQDQISLPWARQKTGVEITDLPHGLYNNPWFRIGAHTRED